MTADASLPPADERPRLTEQEKAANRRRWWGLTDPASVTAAARRPARQIPGRSGQPPKGDPEWTQA